MQCRGQRGFMKPTSLANRLQGIVSTVVSSSSTAALLLLLFVCQAGGSSSKPVAPTPVNANRRAHLPGSRPIGNTRIQLRIGGMPSDSVISLQMKLDTIVATNANGSTVELLTNPVTVEIMHWAGDSEVVAISSLPWGRYTQITANAEVTEMTFVDPSSRQWVTGAPATKYNVTMEFNPSLTVAASPVVLNLQVNPASVLNATAPVGNVNILSAQVFRIAADTLSSTGLLPETGKVERVVGLVTNVSSSALTVVDGQTGASLTFTVNSDTIFHNAPQSTLSGLIVAVRGSSNKDGSLMATEIEAFENRDGLVAEGITSGYIPDSPSVTTILQDGY